MGTVHAKEHPATVGGLFEIEPPEAEEQPPRSTIKLSGVRARVDRVHVDGLSRTKDDIVRATVDELFQATHFEDVIVRAHRVRKALDSMGCFKDVGVYIDVSSGPGATPEGLEVTFQVKELSRIVGGVNTTVSENEANLVVGAKLPNVLGRGEKLQAEYSVGYRSTSNYTLTASKPLPTKHNLVVSTSLYQQHHEYPWSGYRLLDRGLLFDVAFKTSPYTSHNVQWEGIVRDTSVLSKTTSFKVRESSGPRMKSMLRHIVCVDNRDDPIFPRGGSRVQFTSEVAGLGGGVAYLKSELHAEHNLSLSEHVSLCASIAGGVLHDVFGAELPDHFYVGGASSVRGFSTRGLGSQCDGHALGGKSYYCGALHLYAPLPGTTNSSDPTAGSLTALLRSHVFVTGGTLQAPDQTVADTFTSLSSVRVSVGAGLALRLGKLARAELNYVIPLRAVAGDSLAAGLQLGVGAHFL